MTADDRAPHGDSRRVPPRAVASPPARAASAASSAAGRWRGEAKLVLARGARAGGATAHEILDLGDDEYTVGRPHPMIDPRLRNETIVAAGRRPDASRSSCSTSSSATASIPIPPGRSSRPSSAARAAAADAGRRLAVVASVCGTDRRSAGPRRPRSDAAAAPACILAPSNARAARSPPDRGAGRRSPVGGVVGRRQRSASAATSTFFPDGVRRRERRARRVRRRRSRRRRDRSSTLDWRPPAEGDRELGLLLARLEDDPDDPIGAQVAAANAPALERLLAAQPMLVDVRAGRGGARPGLGAELLHSGPPIAWERMCGPVRGAVIGAILFEGWAATPEEAGQLADDGAHRASRRATTTARSARWPASSARRCRWSWSRTPPAAPAPSRRSTRGSARSCASARTTSRCSTGCAGSATTLGPGPARTRSRAGGPIDLGASPPRRSRWATRATTATSPPPRCSRATIAPALVRTAGRGHRRRRARLPARQRPLLPQPVDGRLQGDAGRRARHRGLDRRDRDGPQRGRLRGPPVGHRRRLVHGARRRPGRALLPRLRPGGREPGPRRQRHHRDAAGSAASPWRRRRRSCGSWAAAAADALELHPRDGPHHARPQPGLRPARRSASPGRRPASMRGAWSKRASHPVINTGHRPQAARRRADRRGHRARAAGLLRRRRSAALAAQSASVEAEPPDGAPGGDRHRRERPDPRRPAGHDRRAVRERQRDGQPHRGAWSPTAGASSSPTATARRSGSSCCARSWSADVAPVPTLTLEMSRRRLAGRDRPHPGPGAAQRARPTAACPTGSCAS